MEFPRTLCKGQMLPVLQEGTEVGVALQVTEGAEGTAADLSGG